MIEKMLKVTVVCRIEDKIATLKELRKLESIHVEQPETKPISTEISILQQEVARSDRAIYSLNENKPKSESRIYNEDIGAKLIIDNIIHHSEKIIALEKDKLALNKDKVKLLPWGNFSFDSIEKIAQKGLYVHFCSCQQREFDTLKIEDSKEIIYQEKGNIYFIVISKSKDPVASLPIVAMPSSKMSITELDSKILQITHEIEEEKNEISHLYGNIERIRLYKIKLEESIEFANNKELLSVSGRVVYIKGFLPVNDKKKLTESSKKHHFAILFEEPTNEDRVPTKILLPKILNISKPIFDFLEISPGYKEWDVSWSVLIFLGIFFAIIIGDAGYALIFLIVSFVLKFTQRGNKKAQTAINLFIFYSILAFIWGTLSGEFFSISTTFLPPIMHGLKAVDNTNNIQFICFLIAAIHLSLARFWKATLICNSLRMLGQVGWGLVIWGNFFTAISLLLGYKFPTFAFGLYIVGILLILGFFVHWAKPESLFELPLSIIGSFVDLLSYIRLFAVGIASVYVAENFNMMGTEVLHISPYLAILAILIILAGHILNIILSLMGVLVHGIRLNMLEFSNHMELKWSGITYSPFKKKVYNIKSKSIKGS